MTRQAIAKHFDSLEEAGLAAGIRVGRETRYELRTQAFAEAEAWMRAIGAMWDQRLAAFKEYVESVPSGTREGGSDDRPRASGGGQGTATRSPGRDRPSTEGMPPRIRSARREQR